MTLVGYLCVLCAALSMRDRAARPYGLLLLFDLALCLAEYYTLGWAVHYSLLPAQDMVFGVACLFLLLPWREEAKPWMIAVGYLYWLRIAVSLWFAVTYWVLGMGVGTTYAQVLDLLFAIQLLLVARGPVVRILERALDRRRPAIESALL